MKKVYFIGGMLGYVQPIGCSNPTYILVGRRELNPQPYLFNSLINMILFVFCAVKGDQRANERLPKTTVFIEEGGISRVIGV